MFKEGRRERRRRAKTGEEKHENVKAAKARPTLRSPEFRNKSCRLAEGLCSSAST